MAPRFQTLRPAQTASAREAMRSFFCELCQKGYSRMNEYEAHLSSYDHSHKQRLKDMKAMVRDPGAAARARQQEARATDAVISIKLGSDSGGPNAGGQGASGSVGASGTGFKKGGFRKGGFKSAFVAATPEQAVAESSPSASTAADAFPQPLPTISIPATSIPGASSSVSAPPPAPALPPPLPLVGTGLNSQGVDEESDTDDEGYEVYDPYHPTD